MIKKQLEQLPIIEKHLLRMKKQVKKGNDLTTHQLWSLYKQEKDRIESVYYNSSYKNYDEKDEKQTRFEDKKSFDNEIKQTKAIMNKIQLLWGSIDSENVYVDRKTGEEHTEGDMIGMTESTDTSFIVGYPPRIDSDKLVASVKKYEGRKLNAKKS